MFSGINSAQVWVLFILTVASFVVQVTALVDCLRRPAEIFHAAGKLAKAKWLIILVIAVALGFISLPGGGLNTVNIIAFIAATVYLVDVRPAIRRLTGESGGRSGPYGP